MKLQLLAELLELTTDSISDTAKDNIHHIARLLFSNPDVGPVRDVKRSKEAKYWGIAHTKSLLTDSDGKHIMLTFDNSTDSGEFEVNSLVPLMIERGTPEDHKILSLYRKFGVRSKKKTSYIAHGDKIVLRELFLGRDIDENAVRFMKAVVKLLRGGSLDAVDEEPSDAPVDEVKPRDKKD